MDEDLEIFRGRSAAALLENELLNEALDAIEKKYEDGWRHSKPSGVDVREAAYLMLHVVKEFKSHLTSFVNTGKLAATAQAQRESQRTKERVLTEWDGSPDGLT